LQYLIKWKEYSTAENSWELVEDVHAPELLKELYREQPMAIKVVRIRRTEQCLSDSSSLTSSLDSVAMAQLKSCLAVEPDPF
jgi:Chromo (CHRromatin Organisation MOdifier) domain